MTIVRWFSLVLASLIALPLSASVPAPPVRQAVDQNGVDLIYQTFNTSMTDLSIGPAGSHGLSYTRYWLGSGWLNSLVATISGSTTNPLISVGSASDSFTLVSSGYTSDQGNGSTLVVDGSGDYIYTGADGLSARFAPSYSNGTYDAYSSNIGWVRYIQYPDGNRLNFAFKGVSYCIYDPGDYTGTCPTATSVRLQSVTNSFGYQLKLTYASNALAYENQLAAWQQVTKVTAINNAVEACDPMTDSCSLSGSWPYATYGYTSGYLTTVTDPVGRVWTYSYSPSGYLSGIKRPTAASNDVSVAYSVSAPPQVTSVTRAGVTTNYSQTLSGSTQTLTITDAASHTRSVVSDGTAVTITSDTDQLSRTTSYVYYPDGLIRRVTLPEGNYTTYDYDGNYTDSGYDGSSAYTGRGNVTKVTQVPKVGSGLATIVTSAAYPSTCSNVFTCNKPTSSTDARLNVTTYAYDGSTGLPTSITSPAPGGGLTVQPQTRMSYTTVTSSFNGALLYLPGTTSACRATSSCTGASDETKSVMSYAGSSGNYLPLSVAKGAGDASLTATSSVTYDSVGNVATATDPMSQVTNTYYNADRQLTWAVGPDPDGGGPLQHRAMQIVYNGDGSVASQQTGTAAPNTSGWVKLQELDFGYDAYGRKVSQARVSGSTTYNLVQYSYDSLGRSDCSTVRMNPGAFGSAPAACTAGSSGSYGPDQITRNGYDYASQVTGVTTAYGTSVAQTTTSTYSNNGKLKTVADARNDLTTYVYDGFDRLAQTFYPSPTTPGASSSTDYQQLGYDSASNVTSRRLRNATSITYAYDNLNRLVSKTLPSGTPNINPTFAYDNFGELTQANNSGGGGLYTTQTSFSYDALGRKLSETASLNGTGAVTTSSQYDLAGRQTYLTWGDGFFVRYVYDNIGEMIGALENGSVQLIAINYDDSGNRTLLCRNNSSSMCTQYSYDAISRLSGMTLTPSGTGTTITLGNYSPANQIGSHANSNDAFAWTGGVNVNRGYTPNGQNQYTAITSVSPSPTYDPKGNLTSAGATTYSFDAENQLATVVAGTTHRYYYDPLHRMVYSSGELLRPVWDGNRIIGEYNSSGTLLRRYVPGPGADEPLIWYEGTGTSDKRFLVADERGSIVQVQNASGGTMQINAYDEYGIPQSTNLGRFQYTGQTYWADLGMYYYKARFYSPTLGRFLQTDPIGYNNGLNWYNYVGGDPINNVDPSGLFGGCGEGNATLCPRTSGTETQEPPEIVVPACGGRPPVNGSCQSQPLFSPSTGFGLGQAFSGSNDFTDSVNECALNPNLCIPFTPPQNTQPKPPTCGNGLAAKIANVADQVSLYSGGIATTSGALGLATAPTGAGFAGFESVAVVSGAVSLGASAVGAVAHAFNGDYIGAGLDTAGLFAGPLAGKLAGNAYASGRMFGDLSASQARQAGLVGNGLGTAAGAAGSLYNCR